MTNAILATATATASKHISGGLIAVLVPVLLLIAAVDVYCLVDLARARTVRYVPKAVWAIVILLLNFPIGALLYLFVGRDKNQGSEVSA